MMMMMMIVTMIIIIIIIIIVVVTIQLGIRSCIYMWSYRPYFLCSFTHQISFFFLCNLEVLILDSLIKCGKSTSCQHAKCCYGRYYSCTHHPFLSLEKMDAIIVFVIIFLFFFSFSKLCAQYIVAVFAFQLPNVTNKDWIIQRHANSASK